MRTFKTILVEHKEVEDIFCNLCGQKVPVKVFNFGQDYLHIEKDWGYNSDYDGEVHTIDICMSCYKKLISSFAIPVSDPK